MANSNQVRAAADVDADIAIIKANMPKTYAVICREARPDRHGNKVFELVRRGLRGQPGAFFAIEGKHRLGTRFAMPAAAAELIGGTWLQLTGPDSLVLLAPTAADQAEGKLCIAEVG